MKINIIENQQRRKFLKNSGAVLTWGVVASAFGAALPKGVKAADSAVGKTCFTILYQNGDDITFDFDYYRDHHMATIMKLYGKSIKHFELRKPVSAEGMPPSPYVAVVNFWVGDPAAFAENQGKHTQTLIDDIPNFTNTQAMIQVDEVWGEAGAELTSSKVGANCLTILYPNEEGVRWDADYYREHHMTLIMDLYTTAAISRFEVRKGISGMDGSSKPGFIGTVNIYVANQAAFADAGAKHSQKLRDDVANFSSVMPSALSTEIYGAAST